MPELTQEGIFRGRITGYGLHEADSGAKAVTLEVAVDEVWEDGDDGPEWFDWREHQLTCSGSIWVIKKDGQMNEKQIESLMSYAGWGANFTQLVEQTWEPTPIQFTVEEDEYQGNVRYRLNWLSAYDSTPGGGNVSAEKAAEMDAQFGSRLRAFKGNRDRTAEKAAGSPKKPSKPSPGKTSTKPPTDAEAASEAAEKKPGDNVPF